MDVSQFKRFTHVVVWTIPNGRPGYGDTRVGYHEGRISALGNAHTLAIDGVTAGVYRLEEVVSPGEPVSEKIQE